MKALIPGVSTEEKTHAITAKKIKLEIEIIACRNNSPRAFLDLIAMGQIRINTVVKIAQPSKKPIFPFRSVKVTKAAAKKIGETLGINLNIMFCGEFLLHGLPGLMPPTALVANFISYPSGRLFVGFD